MNFTTEQLAIITEALAMIGQGASASQWALATNASAGAGKTTVIDVIIKAMTGNLKVLATSFTNEAVTNLQTKFETAHSPFDWAGDKYYSSVRSGATMTENGVLACTATVNVLGFAILKEQLQRAELPADLRPIQIDSAIVPHKPGFFVRVQADKLYEIIKYYLKQYHPEITDWAERSEFTTQIMDVIRLVRSDMMDYNDIDTIYHVAHDLRGEVKSRTTVEWAMECLKVAIVYAHRYGVVDFDEQIYLPNLLNLDPAIKFDVVFLDELQNQSFARLRIVLRYLKSGGTFIGMGDEKQEIMGFSGVTIGSFANTVQYLNAKLMRLSESFRFGQNIADQSRDVVPDLIGANKRSADLVNSLVDFPRHFQHDSAVVCRSNAQCVKYMIHLHNRGIDTRLAKVKQAEAIQASFYKIIDDVTNGSVIYDVDDLLDRIEARRNRMYTAYQRFASPTRLQQLVSEHDVAMAIVEGFPRINDVYTLKNTVNKLLTSHNGVAFITAHSAQGLEWDHVYLVDLDFHDGITKAAVNAVANPAQAWMVIAEQQVFYVAKTRARQSLNYVMLPEIVTAPLPEPVPQPVQQMLLPIGE